MKKTVITTGMIISLSLFLSGCTKNAIPDMNEDQKDMVVEYAVSEVLKYDKNQENRLVDLNAVEPETVEISEETPSPEAIPTPSPEAQPPIDEPQVIDNTGEAQGIVSTSTVEEILNLKDIKISCTDYELCDYYPKEAEDLYFEMSATDGNKLLVLKVNVENTASTEQNLNISANGARFKITVNGETKNALTTMLLDDLAYYNGTIAANESKQLVLVCEISEQQASEISSLSVTIKNVDNSATIQVQ